MLHEKLSDVSKVTRRKSQQQQAKVVISPDAIYDILGLLELTANRSKPLIYFHIHKAGGSVFVLSFKSYISSRNYGSCHSALCDLHVFLNFFSSMIYSIVSMQMDARKNVKSRLVYLE